MVALGTAQVIRANARNLPLADNSVDLVVTSPPYFALRSYQDGGEHYAGQIGDEPTPAEFVASLLEVTRECVRVLKPSGSLWVNLGDKYAAHQTGHRPNETAHDADGRATTYLRGSGQWKHETIRQKSLIGIPWRYALACIDELGLILRAEVIWSKPNGLPESVTDRVRRSHEQWFHFTLSPRYFSAVDEIREPHNTEGRTPGAGSGQRFGSTVLAPQTLSAEQSYNPLGKLPGSVWTVPTEPLRVPDHLGVDHFAAFPTEWPKRIIQGWSPAGVCVECGEGRRPVAQRESAGRERSTTAAKDPSWQAINRADWQENVTRIITGYTCACSTLDVGGVGQYRPCDPPGASDRERGSAPAPPTRPAVVLDPFGGTGTTAMVTVDMSADYCRLAEWRTNDRDQLAKVLGIEKAAPVADDEQSLLDLIEGGAA